MGASVKLKPDGVSQGWRGVIYDNDDNSRTLVWQCLHHPPHPSKVAAKACAGAKLDELGKKGMKLLGTKGDKT